MYGDREILALIDECINIFPNNYTAILSNNRGRLLWQVKEVLANVKPEGSVLDLGAGVLPFMLVCQRLGFKCTLVDDYKDMTYAEAGTSEVLEINSRYGVQIISNNIFDIDYSQLPVLDMVTTHDSMEHWHNSPKNIFHALRNRLSPSGIFWIGVPNCVNLRKRITVPFGYGKWTTMDQWYELEIFRDHVREPDVGDLLYIARDLNLKNVKISGKNWIGLRHHSKIVKILTPFIDAPLQLFPTLCSDIYLYGRV